MSGSVRLAPVVNGQVMPDRSINVGHTNMGLSGSGFETLGKMMGHMATLDFRGAEKDASLQHIRTSYAAIPPGDYIVTHVQCMYGQNARLSIGGGNTTGWMPAGVGATQAVKGDNAIRIPAGRIVDAGYLDIVTTDTGGFLQSAKGMIVSRPLGEEGKAKLKADFPEIYSKTVFSRFTPM